MMSNLVGYVERLATKRAQQAMRTVAAQLADVVRNASVEIEGTQVVVRGRGLTKQWLSDPALRFLGKNR